MNVKSIEKIVVLPTVLVVFLPISALSLIGVLAGMSSSSGSNYGMAFFSSLCFFPSLAMIILTTQVVVCRRDLYSISVLASILVILGAIVATVLSVAISFLFSILVIPVIYVFWASSRNIRDF